MPKIKTITKQTDNRFLNMYHLEAENRVGNQINYYVASRAERIEDLQISTGINHADGVVIYSLYGEKRDKVVLIRQYRYGIDNYVYEFPAGLVEAGEPYNETAVREMREETGLRFTPVVVDEMFQKPFYSTVGMTDETDAMVFGYADGEISQKDLEDSEEIEVVIADRAEVKRILKEERVAVVCAYMMMHFLADRDPFAFLRLEGEK